MKSGQAKKEQTDAETNVVELRSDVQALQRDISRIGDRLNSIAGKAFEQGRETVGEQLEDTRETLNAGLETGRQQLAEVSAQGKAVADQQADNLRTTVKAQPLTSCAIAVGAGFVLGAMLRKSNGTTA